MKEKEQAGYPGRIDCLHDAGEILTPFHFYSFIFLDRVSLYSPSWPELTEILLPLPPECWN